MDTLTVVPPPTTDLLARVRAGLDALPAAQRQIGKTEFSMWDAQIPALTRAFLRLPGAGTVFVLEATRYSLCEPSTLPKRPSRSARNAARSSCPSERRMPAQHDREALKNVKEVAAARSGADCMCFLQPHQS